MKASIKKVNTAGLVILVAGLMMTAIAQAEDPSVGLLPTVQVAIPNLPPGSFKVLPPTFSAGVMGADADSPSGRPVKYRQLLVSAQYDTTAQGDPVYIRSLYEFDLYAAKLLAWDDPNWSAWSEYPAEGAAPVVIVSGLSANTYYLLALQVMDSDGAVSVTRGYQREVANFLVAVDIFRPEVTVCEPFLGCTALAIHQNEIAGGQPLNFSWAGDASAYGGTIASYRHGWDLVDPADPNDPGWSVPAGLAPENLFAAERSFQAGIHTFNLRVVDDIGQVSLTSWVLQVVPYVSREFQRELLLIDQTVDHLTNRWPDQLGNARDSESYRNAFWEFLAAASGGVDGFDWERDRFDHTESVRFSDLVSYKAVLCYARNNNSQTLFQQFRPVNGEERFVWLTPYQQFGGNYFQVGGNSMDSYLELQPNYMIPLIFEANETSLVIGADTYIIGFGQQEMPDGSTVARGPRMYPYAAAGIAALDWTSPATKYIYPRRTLARQDRKVDCVGLKGLVLAPDFRANHAVGAAAIADTFFTNQLIDWQDLVDAGNDTLALFAGTFPFRDDEFVDVNLTSRSTVIFPQTCPGTPEAPGGMCVEPMFTGISRMDWMREEKRANGDSGWPHSQYTPAELDAGCGPLGLTTYQGVPRTGAVTNNRTFGYLSYKMIEDKPVRKADVYWGFDPYRFDQNEAQKAIRWVLDYFGLNLKP